MERHKHCRDGRSDIGIFFLYTSANEKKRQGEERRKNKRLRPIDRAGTSTAGAKCNQVEQEKTHFNAIALYECLLSMGFLRTWIFCWLLFGIKEMDCGQSWAFPSSIRSDHTIDFNSWSPGLQRGVWKVDSQTVFSSVSVLVSHLNGH